MTNQTNLSRRSLLATTVGITTAVALPALAQQPAANQRSPRGPVPTFENSQFYTAGKFDEEKARDAIIDLCRFHRYPVFSGMREKLWVSDYGIGRFTEVGLAAIGFANKIDGPSSYMLQELFLLPNQMLPEHWHVKPADPKKGPQKDEGWLVRWGRSYVVGEGEPNLPKEVVVPKSHNNGEVTVKHCVVADPGVFVPLSSVGSRHWQFAGEQGVILTEVANAHDNASVRHTDKTANDTFLKGLDY